MAFRAVYLTWPPTEIAGGIKLAFRHVELLRDAGLDAAIGSIDGASYTPEWFETKVLCERLGELDPDRDIIVLPENNGSILGRFADWPGLKIVLCQNQYMIPRGLLGRPDYGDFGIGGILALGANASQYCRTRFPRLPTFSVPVLIDERLFRLETNKSLEIAFAPRKRPLEVAFIHDAFVATYPAYRHANWIELDGLSESEVASRLKRTAVYLSLQRLESVGMSALEAMACGCTVVGFTGVGGGEYATTSNGFWVGEDDLLGVVRALGAALDLVLSGSRQHAEMIQAATLTARQYGRSQFANRLLQFWRPVLETGRWPSW